MLALGLVSLGLLSLGALTPPAAAQFDRPDAEAFSLRDILPAEPVDEDMARAFARREDGDAAGAVALLEPQAEGGKLSAQMALGFMYGRGDGIARDPARAALWWRRAADQGQAYAQFAFAEASLAGNGVPRDEALAHAYLSIAAERTQRGGPFLDLVLLVKGDAAEKLTPAQREESAAFVARWYADRPALAPPLDAAPAESPTR
jgi:TPR repeat protein